MRNPHDELESNMAATSMPPELLSRFILSNHNPAVLQQYWQERYYSAASRTNSIQQECLKQYSALQYSRFQAAAAAAARLAWRHSYGGSNQQLGDFKNGQAVSRHHSSCSSSSGGNAAAASPKQYYDPVSPSSPYSNSSASPRSVDRCHALTSDALEKLTQFTSSRLPPPPLLPLDRSCDPRRRRLSCDPTDAKSCDPHHRRMSCDPTDAKSCDPALKEEYLENWPQHHLPSPPLPPPPLLPLHQDEDQEEEHHHHYYPRQHLHHHQHHQQQQHYRHYYNKAAHRGFHEIKRRASPRDRSRSPDNRLAYVTSSNQSAAPPSSSSFNGLPSSSSSSLNGGGGGGGTGDVAWTTLSDRRSSSSNMQGKMDNLTDLSSGGENSNLSIPSSPLTPQSMGGGKKKSTSSSGPPLPSPGSQGAQARGAVGKSIEEELCLICGDRASGYHYNALSCEGCKGFFRRSITRGASYNCKYGGHCEMDMWMRRRCQSCRLRRCKEVGMKEECLLSDEQCAARDARRKARQRLLKLQQGIDPDAPDKPNSPDSNMDVKKEREEPWGPVPNPLDYLTAEERELIESIVVYQDKYELPSDTDVKKLQEVRISDMGRPKEVAEHIYKHMAEMTILVTQLVVEFAKNLPGFMSLDKEDQIVLLKGSASEVMVLRTARRYDVETDTVVFANGMPFTKDSMRFAGLQSYVDSMFDFCRLMGRMAVDNAEYALLTAICIFSERPGIVNVKKVEAVQELYLNTLLSYQRWRRPKKSHFLAKLLLKLVELRSLSAEHSDVLFALKVEKGSLPPLLSEYFDVVD